MAKLNEHEKKFDEDNPGLLEWLQSGKPSQARKRFLQTIRSGGTPKAGDLRRFRMAFQDAKPPAAPTVSLDEARPEPVVPDDLENPITGQEVAGLCGEIMDKCDGDSARAYALLCASVCMMSRAVERGLPTVLSDVAAVYEEQRSIYDAHAAEVLDG